MTTLPEVKLKFVPSQHGNPSSPEVVWFLTYDGTLFYSDGGDHFSLFADSMAAIPDPPQGARPSKLRSIVAAGRVKAPVNGYGVYTWASKGVSVTTPDTWKADLQKIFEDEVIPQIFS